MTDDWTVGPYTLRPHQQNAVLGLRAGMQEVISAGKKPRVILQGVCGFGKTLVSSYLMKQAMSRGKKPAFIVHGRALVFQKSDKLCDASIPHAVVMADVKGELRPAATRYEPKMGTPECSVISKDTYASLRDKGDIDPFDVGLWIVDEVHIGRSQSWWRLFEESPAPMIGLSGTPIWSNGMGMGDRWSKIVTCATHQELIDAGYLVGCRYIGSNEGIDTRGVDVNAESGEYVENQLSARAMPLVGNFVEEWWKHAEGLPTAFYASSVSHSIAQAQAFREGDGTIFARPLVWEHIDADTPTAERKRIHKGILSGDIQGVSNCLVLTVGWDNTAIRCIQLGVAWNSLVRYLQAVGRGARPHAGKAEFLVLDHGHNHRHGWPQEDRHWPLDTRKPIWEEQDPAIQTTTKKCKVCNHVYQASMKVCPNCGATKITTAQMVRTEAGELVEIEPPKPKVLRKDRLPEEQTRFEKYYYRTANSKSPRPMTFNSLKGWFQRENPHLRIIHDEHSTKVVNLHTKARFTLGYVPEPHSPLWDCAVRDVPKDSLQKPQFIPEGN